MSERDNGGAAFPGGEFEPQHGGSNDREPWNNGMTLRDYFAGQVLVTLTETGMAKRLEVSMVAKAAYELADAMLEARK